MAGLIEWWMSRPFYDDPAKHGWGVVLLQPLVWILSPLFLMWGVFIWLPRSIWNLFTGSAGDYPGGVAAGDSEVEVPSVGYEVVADVYVPMGTKGERPEDEWWDLDDIPVGREHGRPADEWWDLDGTGAPPEAKEPWMSKEDKIKVGGVLLLVFLVMFILMGASFYAFILSLFFTAVYYSLFLQASVPDSDDNRREWGPSSLIGYSVGFVAVFVGLLAMGVHPVDSFPYATFVFFDGGNGMLSIDLIMERMLIGLTDRFSAISR